MGLYLRKSFSFGPLRLNLSKSGLGLSAGVKGARVGIGPRGTYVHGGRHGLYYRKHLSSRKSRSRSGADGEGCATLILAVIAIGLGVWVFKWLIGHPALFAALIAAAVTIPAARLWVRVRRKKLIAAYKNALDTAFVLTDTPPDTVALVSLEEQRRKLPKTSTANKKLRKIEADVYQAVLDKILDDGFVTAQEAKSIAALEQVVTLEADTMLRAKKDIFSAAYLKAIDDRKITRHEVDRLTNLIRGLGIPRDEIKQELDIVQEIIDAQSLKLPLDPIPPNQLSIRLHHHEEAYHQCSAQVLSRRKSRKSPTGYEYVVRRNGTMVVTNKRVLVIGKGTTTIRYSEIADIDIDIDEGIIEVSKTTAMRPIILKTETPIYTSRIMDLLTDGDSTRGVK